MPAQPSDLQKRIAHFQRLAESKRTSMLRSVEVQFIHMAQGGDGSAAYEGEIRKTHYPTWSTKDFQTVCNVMGWDYSRR